uniref:Uncharacterized protein n=1 Tax=Heterorhabditis bacteriophora TaxID=37862 RepID=A0A1I7W662_HETBA
MLQLLVKFRTCNPLIRATFSSAMKAAM